VSAKRPTVEFRLSPTRTPPTPKPPPGGKAERRGRAPSLARLLALAHHLDWLLRTGQATDLATIAKEAGVTRARLSQVASLILLAPELQDRVLCLSRSKIAAAQATAGFAARLVDWKDQRGCFCRE